ncbi:hypothetical protein HanRHA438_Chr02g0081391 [Helianthus annuus]|nr:hypothetical protein HanRHA438_Chr02g0081391 [Helianthus annuus]
MLTLYTSGSMPLIISTLIKIPFPICWNGIPPYRRHIASLLMEAI